MPKNLTIEEALPLRENIFAPTKEWRTAKDFLLNNCAIITSSFFDPQENEHFLGWNNLRDLFGKEQGGFNNRDNFLIRRCDSSAGQHLIYFQYVADRDGTLQEQVLIVEVL